MVRVVRISLADACIVFAVAWRFAGLALVHIILLADIGVASGQSPDPPGSFFVTGNLVNARYGHTATLLPNGKVLVVGGLVNNYTPLTTAELYDSTTGTWSATGSMATARSSHSATLLSNGKVLVAGGAGNTASAELYDPDTESWSLTGAMVIPRHQHTATLLPNGKVLVAAGYGSFFLNSAELYDPESGSWALTTSSNKLRVGHTATLLPNGKVLVTGGAVFSPHGGIMMINPAELYDPATESWSLTGAMVIPRYEHTATLLPNGKVLVAGGDGYPLTLSRAAELYDPATGSWNLTGNLVTSRHLHTASLLANGTVLIIGGEGQGSGALLTAEQYTPETESWSAAGLLSTARVYHTATTLPSGRALVAAGYDNIYPGFTLAGAELYDPLLPASQPLNISTRLDVLTGDNVLIGGFIIGGSAPKKVILRAIGPSLSVVGTLADPILEIHLPNGRVISNDNWKIDDQTRQSQEAEIRATTIPPSNDLESAIVQVLTPGAYTTVVRGKNGATGIGLVEVYDLDQLAPSKLANISTRGMVDNGSDVMIGGFILGGNNGDNGNRALIVRALGPSLPVSGALTDPVLELHDGDGALLAANDNWRDDPQSSVQVQSFGLAPPRTEESAIFISLASGAFTAIVTGKNGDTGIALVEVYALSN